jgi:hypothetical protein
MPPRLIENKHLSPSDVPSVDFATLRDAEWLGSASDPQSSSWEALWTFALTFDACRFFGADNEAAGRVGAFGASVRSSYFANGCLPSLDLALLRLCLFHEQRLWCKHSTEPPGWHDKQYLDSLLSAIRSRIS